MEQDIESYEKIYDVPNSCNKCGGDNNEIEEKYYLDNIMCECTTKCSDCAFEDYWAYGFFQSGGKGFNAAEKY